MDKKLFVPVILLLILLPILAVAMATINQNGQKVIGEQTEIAKVNAKPQKSIFTPENKPTPTPSLNEFSEPKLRFALSYPSDWEKDSWNIHDAANVKGTVDGNIWGHSRFYKDNKQFEIVVWGNRTKTPILQWLKWYRHEDLDLNSLPKEPNFSVFSEIAVRIFQEKTSFTYPVVRIFFQRDDKLYEILYRMDSLKDEVSPLAEELIEEPYSTILQSFKFLP